MSNTLSLLLALGSLAASLPAAVENVDVLGVTHVQAILTYTAPDHSGCTVAVSESASMTPLVHDVNPSLFAGANSDGGGSRRRQFVVGRQEVGQGTDGKRYSRALQANTQHFFRINCGAHVVTGSFLTRNIPLGSYYPLAAEPQDNSGGLPVPSLDPMDRSARVVDFLTGALMRRISVARDEPWDGTYNTVASATGSAWTAAGNAVADDSNFATYSGTAQAKLALAPVSWEEFYQRTVDFVQIRIKGFATGSTDADRTVQLCLGYNTSENCVSGIRELVLPATNGIVTYNAAGTIGDFLGMESVGYEDLQNQAVRIYLWKKATTGSNTVSIDNVQVRWGKSIRAESTSAGNHTICSPVADAQGFYKCTVGKSLYAIHGETGESRFLGHLQFANYFTVPEWEMVGGNSCWTFGLSSRLFHSTDPNRIYCQQESAAGGTGLVLMQLDSTNTEKPNNIDENYASMTVIANILPSGHRLNQLLQEYDSTLPPWECTFEMVAGQYLVGTCRASFQDSYGYLFAFDIGNGTAITDPSCGTRVKGRCSNSRVGIAGVLKTWEKPIGRWSIVHSTDPAGSAPIVSITGGVGAGTFNYGNAQFASQLSAGITATQTVIPVTSTWKNNTPQSGTVSSSGTTVTGLGTSFFSTVVKGDTITVSGQSRVVARVDNDASLTVTAAFSPNVSAQPWTLTWGGLSFAGNVYQTGDPVSDRGPHYMQPIAARDWIRIGSETMRVVSRISGTSLQVQRGCNSNYTVPCTGTGLAHSSGTSVLMVDMPFIDPTLGAFRVWDWVRDPNGNDTNVDDWANGDHGYVSVQDPYGYGGGHAVARGKVRMMAGYDFTWFPTGITNVDGWTKRSNYTAVQDYRFAGRFTPNGGNSYQRHPALADRIGFSPLDRSDFLWGTDITPFIGLDFGGSGENPAANVEGSVWRAPRPPSEAPYSGPQRKYYPTFAICGGHVLRDISGPGSRITTADTYTYCYAEKAGECRTSSDPGGSAQAGQAFFNCPGLNYPRCTSEAASMAGIRDVCFLDHTMDGNGTIQTGFPPIPNFETRIHEAGARIRPLGKMFHFPRRLITYANAQVIPNGKWILHVGQLSAQGRGEMFLVKNPGMPPMDSVNRTTFIPVSVQVTPPSGLGVNNAVIEFGYDDQFRCTSRDERCVAAANNNPYFFAGESYSGVSCATGCTIQVPGISHKVLRYRILYRNASSAIVGASSTYTLAVP